MELFFGGNVPYMALEKVYVFLCRLEIQDSRHT